MGGLRLLLDGSEGQPSSNPDRSLDEATPCSQSQIGQVRHLRRSLPSQVELAVAVSVIVRWRPARTAVNGTVVTRPTRTMIVSMLATTAPS
jgi:hypothetical protein